ncbi:hypothetical protein FRC08_012959 [Ceratobasidium sp. 394]|nr:hypothetical protein FRC08_012959 [Ceratobasidium sp. 394]
MPQLIPAEHRDRPEITAWRGRAVEVSVHVMPAKPSIVTGSEPPHPVADITFKIKIHPVGWVPPADPDADV